MKGYIQTNIFQCVNGNYHWWITLQVFFPFLQKQYLLQKAQINKKKLLSEFKEKGQKLFHLNPAAVATEDSVLKERSSKNGWDISG